MKSLLVLVALLFLLAAITLLNINDASISVADTSIREHEVTSSQSEENNSTPSATITTTWTTAPLPDE